MDMTLTVGLSAAFLTTIAFLPQALKIWKTKSAKDVSLHTFLAFTAGVALWLVYGILRQELPLILSNGVTLALAGAILTMKLRYG
jgi:MtN3 and saliva related transmembrane protein